LSFWNHTKNKNTLYFPAISVGSFVSTIKRNAKHFWKENQTFRFYKEDPNNPFYFPFMLVSAAHNYKKKNYREDIDFPKDDRSLFFGDSGGFQVLTGKVSKEFGNKKALKWLDKNCDIFPLLDSPIPKDSSEEPIKVFNHSLNFTEKSAVYFRDNRSTSDTTILNVLHGRDLFEIDKWYQTMKKYQFEGWALGGGHTLTMILSSFFYLMEQGEIDRIRLFHIFMMTKMRYIPSVTYLQNLLHKSGYNCFISYDSSYQIIQTAYGRMSLYSTLTGQKWMSFSNKYDYSKLTDENKVPCDCPYCKDVPLKELVQFTGDRFYAVAPAHNILSFVQFKRMIERIIHTDIPEVLQDVFSTTDIKLFSIIDRAWKNRYKKDNYKKVYEELKPIVSATERTAERTMKISDNFKKLF